MDCKEIVFIQVRGFLKAANLRLERLNTLFSNAISQTQSLHNICAVLRKKVVFLFRYPDDQPHKYFIVADLENDIRNEFNTLEAKFQEYRISLMFLDEELFKSLHSLKRSYGFIIKRAEDIVKSNINELTIAKLHDLMNREKACLSMLSDIENGFKNSENLLTELIKKYGA